MNSNFLNDNIRNISNVSSGFSQYSDLINEGRDYTILENARKLDESEYTINQQLGFISLNQSLNNDEILGIAYQYTYQGEVFQVGEFSSDPTDSSSSTFFNKFELKDKESTCD